MIKMETHKENKVLNKYMTFRGVNLLFMFLIEFLCAIDQLSCFFYISC